jgi:hypothetical protein
MSSSVKKRPAALSIGILVCEEMPALRDGLESLFRQSVFGRLCARHEQCEILVVAHERLGATIAAARGVFDGQAREHPWADGFTARVIEIPERGRPQAWNRFAHEFSAIEARYLCLLEAGVLFHHRDTIHNLMAVLDRRPHVPAATGREVNALALKEHRSWSERFSVAQTALRSANKGSLCEQLYCLRTPVARALFLPADLDGAEADFITQVVRTEFFTRDSNPQRIARPPEVAHLFETGGQNRSLIERQRQRALARAALHVLLEHLKTLSWDERLNLGDTLRRHEAGDPDWLKKLVASHLRWRPFFWPLFPGAFTLRFKQLLALPGVKKLTLLPAACAGSFLTLVACATARRVWRRRVVPAAVVSQPGPLATTTRTRVV